MKKNILIMMTILLITGCGKKVDLTKIKDEMSKKDNYQMDINVKGYGIKQDITIKKINDKNYEIIVNDLNRYTFKDDKIYKNDKETNEEVKYNDYEKYLNILDDCSNIKEETKKIGEIDYKLYTCDLNKKIGKKLVDNTSLKDIEIDKVNAFIYANNDNTIYQMEFKLNDKSTIKVNYSRYENTTLNDEFDITNSKLPVIGG